MPHIFHLGRAACLALAALVSSASAQIALTGTIAINHPWTRATPNGAQVGVGYLTITNRGPKADTLTGGSLEAASGFEIHDTSVENGVMRMRPAGPVDIPPGATVAFAPGGRHIMFTGLTRSLKKGETLSGTLIFKNAGTLPIRFPVEAIGAKMPPMPGME